MLMPEGTLEGIYGRIFERGREKKRRKGEAKGSDVQQ